MTSKRLHHKRNNQKLFQYTLSRGQWSLVVKVREKNKYQVLDQFVILCRQSRLENIIIDRFILRLLIKAEKLLNLSFHFQQFS